MYEFYRFLAISAMIALLLLFAKYSGTFSLEVPAPARPHIDKLKWFLENYSFDFKKDLVAKAIKLLKEDYKTYLGCERGNYIEYYTPPAYSGFYKAGNQEYYKTLFTKSNKYAECDIIETWAICAILDFNGLHSGDDEYLMLLKQMKSLLIQKYECGKCPAEIYECFENSNNIIETYKSSIHP